MSIVLPVYNQADHIEAVVAGYESALARIACPHELLLVTNGCRDDSPAICAALENRYASVRAINSAAGGWGLAVKLGLREARGDLLAYTNSARTPADQLALLVLAALLEPERVTKARRTARTPLRRLGSTLYNWESRVLFGISSRDVNGTPKIFPRQFSRLLALSRGDDLIDLEFMSICRREGYPVQEFALPSQPRHGGESTTRLKTAWKLYSGAFRMWRQRDA